MEKTKNRVQSLETGGAILRYFAHAARPLTLSAVAASSAMPPGKVHRYLQGLIASGLLVQDRATRLYDLGPLAYSLGVAALQRHDSVRAASNRLDELRAACGESVSLMIWGDRGPVVIRSEESRHDVAVVLRIGGVVRLTTSSAGHVFAAFLPAGITQPLIDAELAAHLLLHGEPLTAAIFTAMIDDVRVRGLSCVHNGPVADATAVSAPIFVPDGRIVAVVSVVGRTGTFAHAWGGSIDRELRAFTARIQAEGA